jgi:hypothetical protein
MERAIKMEKAVPLDKDEAAFAMFPVISTLRGLNFYLAQSKVSSNSGKAGTN